jgi:hypothetical protein
VLRMVAGAESSAGLSARATFWRREGAGIASSRPLCRPRENFSLCVRNV